KGLAEKRPLTSVYQGLPSLAPLMLCADLMIGAGGSTTWERMCLGLPAIVISIADNQVALNQALQQAGYIAYVGDMSNVDMNVIIVAIRKSLSDSEKLKEQSALGLGLVPGTGAAKLCEL